MGAAPRFQLVDFIPNNAESMEWAQDRAFYLFGGSGNQYGWAQEDAATLTRFQSEDQGRLRRMMDEIERDPHAVIQETDASLRLVDGFLDCLGRSSLREYVTSSLYGENGAYDMKVGLEEGENMVRRTLQCLKRPVSPSLWVAPQITPYFPYVSMVFLRPDFAARHFSRSHREEDLRIEPLAPGEDRLRETARRLREEWDRPMPEYHLVHLWNEIHTQTLSRIYGAATVFVRHDDAGETAFWKALEGDGQALAPQWRDTRAYRFEDAAGFVISTDEALWRITDVALIGTLEMTRRGGFRFLRIDHGG